MNISAYFSDESRETPFSSYREYTDFLFASVNRQLSSYIEGLMRVFANNNGGFKNVLYPDIEIAHDLCGKQLSDFASIFIQDEEPADENESSSEDNSLESLFASLVENLSPEQSVQVNVQDDVTDLLEYVRHRAALTDRDKTPIPLYDLMTKLGFSPFAEFAFVCALLSSTQTSYASVFQVVNQNGSLSAPSIESAARVFFGKEYSITAAYGEMSLALEQLEPVLMMQVNSSMPFSTLLSPDKRIIDFLFSPHPLRVDESYDRFFSRLEMTRDPFIANRQVLDAININYDDGGRLFNLFGDEGSGRKFTISHFCQNRGQGCVVMNCSKLFVYDFNFVDRALWSITRECILTDSACCLNELGYHEEEKEKFFGYMDLAFGKLKKHKIAVFNLSKEKLPMRELTNDDYAQLELPTPNNNERIKVWEYYSKGYKLGPDVDLYELATKFLFTPGKIKNALHQGRSISAMAKEIVISRASMFQSCNSQMSHELTQKATRVAANFGWDDIVMNPDQRLALKNACDQLIFRKQVYEDWNYIKKYPYGRGLSVLLFGAPGTGKSMCAQVIAHEMNLELYRVDLSKVVDKYVGETEKSISMIFREAKKCNVVLFFDECDTLFAKRSDDGGSNQSSNNNKTALLLQEVEAYDGVSVLATNYKHNIDPAFFRRMKFIVEFQFPDVETRKVLWSTTIPKTTPLAEDVDIDFLAQRFEFVGGNIKNCILNAAFLAAADPEAEGEVHMKHYLQAIKYEFVKTGKVFTRSDFEPYAHLVL